MAHKFFVTTIVDSYSASPAYALSGTGDSILVTNAAALLSFGPEADGIDLRAAQQAVTINGLVYSAQHDAIYGGTAAASASILIAGDVEAERDGINLSGNTSYVAVEASGNVYSDYIGVGFGGDHDHLVNSGHISGRSDGVEFAHKSGTMENDGTISSVLYGVVVYHETSMAIDNGGIISGAVDAIGVNVAANMVIDNSGTIHGPTAIAVFDAPSLLIQNGGLIEGNLEVNDASSNLTLYNQGTWAGGLGFGGGADTLRNSGTVTGNANLDAGHNTVINSGMIGGDVSFAGGTHDSLINSGTIHGEVAMGSSDTLLNEGFDTRWCRIRRGNEHARFDEWNAQIWRCRRRRSRHYAGWRWRRQIRRRRRPRYASRRTRG